MKNANSKHWAIGIHEVCNAKNRRWHKSVKAKPYDLLYGQVNRTILQNLPLDPELLNALSTESQLANLIGCHDYAGVESEDDFDETESEESEDLSIVEDVSGLNPDISVNAGMFFEEEEIGKRFYVLN